MIEKSPSIRVMKEFGPYLRFLKAFKMDQFCQNIKTNWRKALAQFALLLRVSIILIVFWITIISAYRFCIDYDFRLRDVSIPMLGVFCATEVSIVCFLLSGKAKAIENAIDFLQKIVEHREYFERFAV